MNALTFYLIFFASLLVLALTGFIIRKRVSPEFQPLLIFFWTIFLMEIFQVFFDSESTIAIIARNFQYLIEMLLVTWIARKWGLFDRRKSLFPALMIAATLIWTTEKLVDGWLIQVSWCRVLFSFGIVVLALFTFNRATYTQLGPYMKSTVFLFSLALIFNYATAMFYELFFLVANPTGEHMLYTLFYIGIAISILTNIIYLKAVLCIPKKVR